MSKSVNKKIENSQVSKVQSLLVYLLIFGNTLFLKDFASIKFGTIFYINEILLFLLLITLFMYNKTIIYYLFLLIPLPAYSLLIKNYELRFIFQDYALIYYPFLIFIFTVCDKNFSLVVRKNLNFLHKVYPIFPFYYTLIFLFTSLSFRATEAVCFSIIFYFYTTKFLQINYSNMLVLFYFVFLFFLAYQHRSSMLLIFLLIVLMLITKTSLVEYFIILVSILVTLLIYQIPYINNGEFRSEYRNFGDVTNRNYQIICFNDCSNLDEFYYDYEAFLEAESLTNDDFPEGYFEYVDGWTNIQWRIEIYKASYEELSPFSNNLLRNTLGENLISTFVNNKSLPHYMYQSSLVEGELGSGLRNAHNTFLTLILRFGFLFSTITFIFLLIHFLNVFKQNKQKLFLFLPFIQTFFDPLLDGPVLAIPFFILFFSLTIRHPEESEFTKLTY